MMLISVVVTSFLVTGSWGDIKLPNSFMLGAATSAYQIEGAWNVSDKSENVWDHYLHQYPNTTDGNIDVACDSYHLWRRDIEMIKELGLQMYRFSISWTRLVPNATHIVSEHGKKFYNNFIDALVEAGVEPVVTLFHLDLPQWIQDLGGWANPVTSDFFADYANIAFSIFGDRVKYWLTINEPIIQCDMGYNKYTVPFVNDPMIGKYLCSKNILLAHAKAFRIYDTKYRPKYKGYVSILNLLFWLQPETPDQEEVTNLSLDYMIGRFSHPIFSKQGGWPPAFKKFMEKKSKTEGYSVSRLPDFTEAERVLVQGSHDTLYAFNHYTTRLVRKAKLGEPIGFETAYGFHDLRVILSADPSWELADDDWFGVYPKGIRKAINHVWKNYNINQILITENGFLNNNPSLNDTRTVNYTRDYLEQVGGARDYQDNINVIGYIDWSLMDNFEGGYTTKYGMYSVDFSDANRTRTPRASAYYMSSVARTKYLGINNSSS